MAKGAWKRLGENLGKLAQVPSRIARPISDGLNVLIQEQFAQGKDPYGTPWKPLAPSTVKQKGHARILIRTNTGRTMTMAIPMKGAGIRLVSVDYLGYHMTATANRPARPVFPWRAGLPKTWSEVIQREWRNAFEKTMRSR